METDRKVQVNNGTVRLAGVDLDLLGDVRANNLARFMGKVTFGDYSHDSDSLQSTVVWSSFTGGIGVETSKEGVDDEVYWTGSLETRYPGMVTLPAYTWEFPSPTAPVTRAYPVADFPASAPSLWAMFGTTLCKWNEVDREFTVVGTLAGDPANKGVEYNDLLWIPLGTGGYATVTELGAITAYTDLDVIAFTEWDNKIAALTVDGELRLKYQASPWEALDPNLVIPSGHIPRNLVVFLNQRQESTIHIITNKDVWAYDRETSILLRTHLRYPRHPDQGLASTVWRGESMYVSVGIGIHGYNGGIITAMGPDGRQGLPSEYRGRITDLEPEYNNLIAVVEGKQERITDDQDLIHMRRQYQDDGRVFPEVGAYSSILRWGGHGWHPVWVSDDTEGLPTWAHVSEADNNYRLWWGYGGRMFYQKLPVTFHNSKEGMKALEDEFADTGRIILPWFDADMTAFDKLASHCEVVLDDVFEDGTPTGSIKVYYQTDSDAGWHLLDEASVIGRTVMPFNMVVREGSDQFSAGLVFRRIRFMLVFEGLSRLYSPVMRSFMLKFIKIPLSNMSWTFEVDLSHKDGFMGQGIADIAEHLRMLAYEGEFHEFIHRDQTYRVRVAQTQGSEKMGLDPRSTMTVSVIEVPMTRNEHRLPASGP